MCDLRNLLFTTTFHLTLQYVLCSQLDLGLAVIDTFYCTVGTCHFTCLFPVTSRRRFSNTS